MAKTTIEESIIRWGAVVDAEFASSLAVIVVAKNANPTKTKLEYRRKSGPKRPKE